MNDQTAACLYLLAPLATFWLGFAVAEAVMIVATVRAERRK